MLCIVRSLFIVLATAIGLPRIAPAQDDLQRSYSPGYIKVVRQALQAFSMRDFETATQFVDRADKMYPATPVTLNIRGAILIEQEKFEEGRAKCIAALKLDPKFYPARFNLAEIPFVQKKYPQARIEFERLLAEEPATAAEKVFRNKADEDLLRFRIFLTHLFEGKDADAKAFLDKLPELNDSPIFYLAHSAWHFAHKEDDKGREWISRSRGIFSESVFQNFIGTFYDHGWMPRPGGIANPKPSEVKTNDEKPESALKLEVKPEEAKAK